MEMIEPPKSLDEVVSRLSLLFKAERKEDLSVRFEGHAGSVVTLLQAEDGRARLRAEAMDVNALPATVERWTYGILTGNGQSEPDAPGEEAGAIARYLKHENRRFALRKLWGDLGWIDEYVRSSEEAGDWVRYTLSSVKRAQDGVKHLAGMLGVPFNEADMFSPFGGVRPKAEE